MTPPLPGLALLPGLAFLLVLAACHRPAATATPLRLAVLRAAVVVGGVAVLSTEALSARRALTAGAVATVWVGTVLVAGATACWRHRRPVRAAARRALPGAGPRPGIDAGRRLATNAGRRLAANAGRRWAALPRADRVLLAATGGLLLAELVLAVASAPNTYDSQTYHLPRIEHWIAQRSVAPYPVAIHRQVTYPPGAEYLMLHLRLLSGGDALTAMVQWLAGLLCLVAVTRLTAQLGGGRRAQLLAGFVFAGTPAVVLEASSTQVDLVVAAWVATTATLVLDGVGRRPATAPAPGPVLLIATATGLVAVTKSPGLLVIAPLLVWWGCAWLRRSQTPPLARVAGVAGSALAVAALTAALTGPYLWRTWREFGNPLGPSYVRNSISLQRHDPAAVTVNALRQAQTVLDTPIAPLRTASVDGVIWVAHRLGVDPQDPKITFDDVTYPAVSWYPSEGRAAFPIQALLLAAGTVAALAAPGAVAAARRRLFGSVLLIGVAAHLSTVKWSPWSNRLGLYLVVLAAPLAGVWLAALLEPRRPAPDRPDAARRDPTSATGRRGHAGATGRRVLVAVVVLALAGGGVAGGLSAALGWPRRLVGSHSALLLDDWDSRFVTRPAWAGQFAAAGAAVRASGARRIGIVEGGDSWEYPWWLLLRGRELVALQSQLPHHPPAALDSVDAVVCTQSVEVCGWYRPQGWTMHPLGAVTYILPPR